MIRIASSSTGRGLALVLLLALGAAAPLAAPAEDDRASGSRKASPPRAEETQTQAGETQAESVPAEAGEPETEFELIRTPFGTVRQPKRRDGAASGQAASAQDSPPPAESREEPAPVESGDDPQGADEAASSGPEAEPAPAPLGDSRPAGRSGDDPGVRFNCVECSLLEFVRNVAQELKLNYVLDPRVQGVVDIHTFGEMRRSDLASVLETVLEINGAALVRTGSVYRIVPSQATRQLPLEVRRDPGPSEAPAGENRVLQVVPMNFVPAADMAALLTPYLSDGGDINHRRNGNFLVIADTPENVAKLLELVRVFDSDVFGGRRVRVYPLENSRATDLALDLEGIFAGVAEGEEPPVRFIPIPRLNSILAVGSSRGMLTEVEGWISRLDQAGLNREMRNFFVKVQNGDAVAIARLLLQIYGMGRRAPAGTDLLQQGGGAAPAREEQQELIQGEIKIVADDQNNALIVQCSAQDFKIIEETIRELDRVPRQVLINVKIYEVLLDKELSMGVSAFLQERNNPVVAGPLTTTGGFGPLAAGLNLATRALVGDTRELVAFLNAQETRNRTRVLSAPSVIASDNVEANIQVGSQVPILTSQGVVPGGTGGGSLFSNTIQNRNTGVILNVTPRINAGGWVTLEVQQEVSSPGAPPTGGIRSPTINIRSVNTQVTVKNGQTIAIGGIISESNGIARNRVPLLGRIPGLGLLFGNTTRKKTRTELIALITPHVIEDIEQAGDLTEALKSTLKGLKKELSRTEG